MENRVKEINKNFLIRGAFFQEKGTFLIGAGQYHKYVGKEIELKHFERVLNGKKDRYTFKVRSTLKIDFIQK